MLKDKIEEGVRLILEGLEVDLNDRNYKDTPQRVARMYEELFTPRPNNFQTFEEDHDEIVVLRNHVVHGVCPHHLVPVRMRVSVGYLPHKKVLGLSKLARVAESPLTGPILQEAYTARITQLLDEAIEPRGIGVIVVGDHGCIQHRGVRSTGDVVTTKFTKQLLLNPAARQEFEWIVGKV